MCNESRKKIMKIQIISKKIDQKVLLELTNAWFKSFVKFVADISNIFKYY